MTEQDILEGNDLDLDDPIYDKLKEVYQAINNEL